MDILLELITRLVVSAFFRIQQGPSPEASTLGDLVAVTGNLDSLHECSREKEDGKKKLRERQAMKGWSEEKLDVHGSCPGN